MKKDTESKIVMPNLIGKELDKAREELNSLGLKLVDLKKSCNKEKKNNIVLKQSIDEGTKISKETEITLTINSLEDDLPEELKSQVNELVQKVKSGKITYAELANKLEKVNPENIDKVFDKFEELGIDLADDFEEL